ncbi:MAG: VOC family protein [Dehalococcoidia bacterium]|nr:VOC family protein [Dehalococcoidia bacterium]
MKAERLDRVHIAVKDLDKATKFFSEILGTTFSDPIPGNGMDFKIAFSPLGLELVQPTNPEDTFAKFIDKRGEGLFSLCFKVPDIDKAIEKCQSMGMRLVTRMGGGTMKEAQFHPKDCFGVSIVLCEFPERLPAEVSFCDRSAV